MRNPLLAESIFLGGMGTLSKSFLFSQGNLLQKRGCSPGASTKTSWSSLSWHHLVFFPTCQVRVVRFYQSCCPPPPPPPPPVSPRPCLHQLPPPLPPCQLFAKLFANFRAQCALLDLNLGPSELSAHCWTSTWDLPSSVRTAGPPLGGPQRPDRMPEDMPDRMSDRMPEDMPDRMPEDMPDRMPDKMSDRMPEDMPDKVPECLPDRMPEDLPDDMPEDMPGRMPDRMPEERPEHMPEVCQV